MKAKKRAAKKSTVKRPTRRTRSVAAKAPTTSGKLVDSGAREVFETGGMREPNALRYDLIPQEALERMAEHYGNGAKKYADRNWEKGISLKRCFSSAVGHLYKWAKAKTLQQPMEEDHLAAAAWNIFVIITFEERIMRQQLPRTVDDWSPINE